MNAPDPIFKAQPQIGFGEVRHTRLRPRRHAFAYKSYFLMLPMRSLRLNAPDAGGVFVRNRRAPLSFFDRDHGDGREDSLAWLEETLLQHGITDADGEIWLQTYPRVWGYVFKPVSFWYCYRHPSLGSGLRAIVAEVNNTFGERHCYLLSEPHFGQPCVADKVFHVSPFCPVRGQYRFVFMHTQRAGQNRIVARVDYFDEAAKPALLNTSLSGNLQPLDAVAWRLALWRHPAMTLGVMVRIHWQALQLWFKRAPFFRQPPPPREFVTTAQVTPAWPRTVE